MGLGGLSAVCPAAPHLYSLGRASGHVCQSWALLGTGQAVVQSLHSRSGLVGDAKEGFCRRACSMNDSCKQSLIKRQGGNLWAAQG